MKAEKTIRDTLRWVKLGQGNPRLDQRAADQAYGAAEALRWVLGDGPNPQELTKPLSAPQGGRSDT